MLWQWIRAKVKAAFLAGIEDAIEELTHGEADDSQSVEALHRRLTTPALPAPATNGHARTRRTHGGVS